MRIRSVAIVAVLLVALVRPFHVTPALGQSIDAVVTAWESRQDRNRSGRFAWTEVKSMPRGSIALAGGSSGGTSPNVKSDIPPSDATFQYTRSLTFDDTKLRYTDSEPIWSGRYLQFDRPRATTKTWNGTVFKELDTSAFDDINQSRGYVRENPISLLSLAILEPVLMHFRPPLDRQYMIVSTNSVVNGASCLVLRPKEVTMPIETLWVEPKRDCAIIRRVLERNGAIVFQADVGYTLFANEWVPSSWQLAVFGQANMRPMTYKGTLSKHDLNPDIDPSEFELAFSPGTLIYDTTTGNTSEWYVIRDDLVRRPVSVEELARTTTIDQLMTTWPEGMAPRPLWVTIASFVGFGICVVVVMVLLYRRLAIS